MKRYKIKDDVSSDEDDFLLDKLGNRIYGNMEQSIASQMYPNKSSMFQSQIESEIGSGPTSPS